MRSIFTLIFAVMLFSNSVAQTFADFVERVHAAPGNQQTALVDSFMNAIPAFPFVEQDTLAHFLYRGNASSVHVPGDANNWNPTAFVMTRLALTDLWFYTIAFEPDARVDYKFVINGNDWILDSRNPNTVAGGFGPNSELAMPDYMQPEEIAFFPNIPHGALRDTTFVSTRLGNSRTIRIYTPPNYQGSGDSYPVVLFHDGLEYISLASANNVFDYLIHENRIQPIIAVFVPPVNRSPEYAGNQQNAFTAFIIEEVMPWVDARYRTRREPQHRAVIGASNGGNISLWIGLNHPDVFGLIGAQSTNVESNVSSGYQNRPPQALKLYIDIGTYDIPLLVDRVNNFIPLLIVKGYDFKFHTFHEGHSWGNWRAHLDIILERFFPANPTKINQKKFVPNEFRLLQNYPNPFNPSTTIGYSVAHPAFVALNIYNVSGQLVRSMVEEEKKQGQYQVVWDGRDASGHNLSSGVYLYELQINGVTHQTRKGTLLK